MRSARPSTKRIVRRWRSTSATPTCCAPSWTPLRDAASRSSAAPGTRFPSRKWAGLQPGLRDPSDLAARRLETAARRQLELEAASSGASEWAMPPCAADPCCAAFEDDGTLYDELTGTPLYTKSYDDGSQHDAGCAAAATAPLAGFDASCGAAGCAPPASSLFGDQLCGCGVDFSGDEDEFVRGGARFAAPPAEVPRIPRDPRSQFPGGLPLVTIPLEFPSAMDWATSDGASSDGGERKAKKLN